MDVFVGEIKLFPYEKIPSRDGWVICNGQILAIQQYAALFSLIGKNFGGDGITTFGLPNMNGRTIWGGFNTSLIGTKGGAEKVALTTDNLPAHDHKTLVVNSYDSFFPNGQYIGNPNIKTSSTQSRTNLGKVFTYITPNQSTPLVNLNAGSIGASGGSVPHENRMPYVAMVYCIATSGIYPARPY